jgi:hypothetical protein
MQARLTRVEDQKLLRKALTEYRIETRGRRSRKVKAAILVEVAEFFSVDVDELEGKLYRETGEWVR